MSSLSEKLPLKQAGTYASPRRESEYLPLVYGDMDAGGEGGLWQTVCLDTASHVYALAGHALLPLAAGNQARLFDKDGAEISSADYSLDLAHDFQGKGVISTATFVDDPQDKEPISARAKGKAGQDGALLENPLDILRDALLGVFGLDEDDICLSAWARAWARSAGLGFRAAGVLEKPQEAAKLLTRVLGQFLGSWWRGADGKVRVYLDLGPGAADEAELSMVFNQANLSEVSLSAKLDELVNQAGARYAFNYLSGEYEEALEEAASADPKSQGFYGVRAQDLELSWVRDASTAATVCQRLVGMLARPRRLINAVDNGLVSLPLEKGDAALLSLDWVCDQEGRPLVNQIVRVLSVEPDLDRGVIRYGFLDTGFYKTSARRADGAWPADGGTRAGGERDRRAF